MEGSKYEKALLVLVSYIIGFTTAFIAFGISKLNSEPSIVAVEIASATVAQTKNTTPVATVFDDDTGLYLTTEKGNKLLSVNRKQVKDSNLKATNGIYFAIIGASLSPDDKFVYFCEQLSEVPAECDALVYSLEADTVHRVKLGEEPLKVEISKHEATWTPGGVLQVGDFQSINVTKPWKLK